MDIKTPLAIQKIIDARYVHEFTEYIQRRNKRHPDYLTNLAHICKRFRMDQATAKRIIEGSTNLGLSSFAYKPPSEDASFGEALTTSFFPQLWPEAPDGRRLVIVFGEQDE